MWDHGLSLDSRDKPTPWRMKNISLRDIHIITFTIGKYCLICLSPEISLKQKPKNTPLTQPNTDTCENFILGCVSWFEMQVSVPMKRTQRDLWATHPEKEGRSWSSENWIDGPCRLDGGRQGQEAPSATTGTKWGKKALLLLGFQLIAA